VELDIRPARGAAEIEACARMTADSEPWLSLGYDVEAARRALCAPERELHVAAAKGEVAGYVLLNLTGPFAGYIQSICVAPGLRSRGVGRRLVQHAETRVFADHPNLFICVSDFNAAARGFYERLGYAAVGELKDYLVGGRSEILLRKSISPLMEFRRRPTRPGGPS
jgi:ribosomal protein S18 acetylase RimI-like enzyme